MYRAMAVRAKWYQVSCRIVWSGLAGKRKRLQVMNFNNTASIAIKIARNKTAYHAGCPVDTQAEQTIAWISFASAYDGQFDSAFSQRFLLGRCTFLDRIVSIKLSHCGKNRKAPGRSLQRSHRQTGSRYHASLR